MVTLLIIGTFQFTLLIGSDTLQTDTCPTTHPYAFSGGRECCKTQKEASGVVRKRSLSRQPRHPHSDVTCDGSALDLESNCCENGALIRCPAGDGKLCSDGNANGKLLIILNLFDKAPLVELLVSK